MARVLIIEDDELLRNVLVQSLEMAGHVVAEAANGLDGLEKFRNFAAHVVVTDLVMPVQEGVETIMELRRIAPGLPIIAMSGGVPNSKLYLDIAGRFGARRVLPKPFTPQMLLKTIDEVIAEHGLQSGPA